MARVVRCASVALILAVVSACSSTSEKPSQVASKRRSTTTSSVADAATASATGEAGGAVAGPGSVAGRAGARRSTGGARSGADGKPAAGSVAGAAIDPGLPGPGVTPGKIKLGIWILDLSGTCAAVGVASGPGCEASDEDEFAAIVKYVNSRGGIAGRQIEAVVVKQEIQRSTYDADAQAACESFTRDHKVFAAVVPAQFARGGFVSCMAERGTPVIDSGTWPFDAADYDRLRGFLYQPTRARPERWVAAYVDGLAEQGFFDAGAKVGLVRFDGSTFTRVTNNVLKSRLAAHRQSLADEAIIKAPANAGSAYGEMNAELNNAILRFRQLGVNRVLFFTTLGEVQLFFVSSANGQGYRPRYGMSSMDWGALLEQYAPQDALRGAVGVGWLPGYDVAAGRDPGGSESAALCKKVLQDGGQEGAAGRNAKCDSFLFLKAALDRASVVNAVTLKAGVEAIGSSFQPAETFSSQFGANRHDGAGSVRPFAYDEGCDCFKYTGSLRALP